MPWRQRAGRNPEPADRPMSRESLPPGIENPLALALAGERATAFVRERELRGYFRAGLERLADEGAASPRAALEALACAADRFGRYNEGNNRTPVAGDP